MDRIIAVVGATGAQGGGLVRAIAERGGFRARAITRKPDGDKARELAAAGVEVVRADLDDPTSLVDALQGAWGAFFVTNFWEHFSPEREMQQARNLADAAAAAGLRHVIWSTLEDTRKDVPLHDDRMPTLQGQYKVPHFDGKGEADAYFTERGVPTTFLRASFYWDNFVHFGMGPRRGDDGVAELVLPMGDKRLSGVAAKDIGGVALGIFERGESLVGETVGAAGDELTGDEMASVLSEALGEEVRYVALPVDVYRSLGFPGADDLGNMFQYYQEFEEQLAAVRSVKRSRELHPALQDFRSWVRENAAKLRAPEAVAP